MIIIRSLYRCYIYTTQGNADLAEVPGSIAYNESIAPTFDVRSFEFASINDRMLATSDKWALELVGKTFKYKEHELEGDQQFKFRNPSSLFIIHSVVVYNAEKKEFLHANVRYAKKSLHFIFYSVDDLGEWEISPVVSFNPRLLERKRFYVFQHLDDLPHGSTSSVIDNEHYGDFMQGVHDSSPIFTLSPMQMGLICPFYDSVFFMTIWMYRRVFYTSRFIE